MDALEELPAPNLPPPDLERSIDELQCDVGIRQACCALDARVVHMLKCKTEVVATEARQAAHDLIEDTEKLKSAHTLQAAQYEFVLSKDKSDTHTLRQEMMILQLKLSAAEDDLVRRRAAAEAITNQMTLESSINRSLTTENAILRGKAVGLQDKLNGIWTEAYSQIAEREAEVQELRQQLQMDGDQSKNELVAALNLTARLRDEIALAERTAAAAQERANLAEQTLRHREVLATERAQMQAEMQHYSQDLAKMALKTGNSANNQLLAETQATLKAEKKARSAAEARCVQLEKQLAKLEGQLETKTRRVARLEEALTQNATATPAGARAVSAAMNAVGGILSQLDNNSPDSEMPQRRKPASSLLGEKKKVGGSAANNGATKRGRKGLAPVPEEEEEVSDDDYSTNPSFGDRDDNAKPKKKAKMTTNATADLMNNNKNIKDAAAILDLKHVWGDADDDNGADGGNTRRENTNKINKMLPPAGKLQNNPLAALNPATVASAANQARMQVPPLKPVTARPLLGVSGYGGSKRKLLGVSNNTAFAGNDHLPAGLLVRKDSGFTMPKVKQ
ncbi:hypothetical protein Ndes2526B_g06897 [Nannochloris sp. 'desiccata']|nr:hypothetical protein KSW81_005004 [Chlorella desiccata (nom. nud.)]KAH7618004.1 hypothetical protein NADE_000205 [Chlorella desiccata (nom. nud.)]